MEDSLKIMILENDADTCNHFTEYIKEYSNLSIINITNDSFYALKLLSKELPHAIILDLELYEGKGNGVLFLQEMKQISLPFKPYILVTTNNTSAVTLEYVRQLGADFIFSKHQVDYSEHTALDFLDMMKDFILNRHVSSNIGTSSKETKIQQEKNLRRHICRELDQIGIRPKMIGYQYLTDAILLVMEGHNNNLCESIGLRYHKTGSSVERAMQNAIKSAWRSNDIDDLLQYYTAKINPERGVPTMTEFIYHYATKLKNEL